MRHQPALLKLLVVSCLLLLAAQTALAQSSVFTYQGRLTDEGVPSNGTYELEFKLFDAASGGTQQPQPSPVTIQFTGAQAVAVVNGLFTVQLDFGADAFPGAARYLEIGVRHAGDSTFTTLSPRQPISSTPYAIRSASAATATDFSGSLAGDVTGTQGATVVNAVGGQSAANVASAASAANAATDANTAGAIVKRDASGNFSAGTITASLNGNASTATTATTATNATSATNFSGSLSGDVTGTQSVTAVASVGGQTAANVASGASAANAATESNTAGAIVKRDASGNFSAGTITAALNGNASTATTADTATTATTATTASAVSSSAGDSVVTAINASSSTVNAARLPSTLATQNGSNTFSGTNTFSTSPTFSAGLSAGGQRITSVATPTAASDAATKAYVDASVASSTGGVTLLPAATQTATQASGATHALIDVKLIGTSTSARPATAISSR
jgi:hypothetical protein